MVGMQGRHRSPFPTAGVLDGFTVNGFGGVGGTILCRLATPRGAMPAIPWEKVGRTGRLRDERESAGKPGSVEGNHPSGTHVAVRLKRPTRKPLRAAGAGPMPRALPYLVLLQVGFAVPPSVATGAVRSYRTVSPLPAGLTTDIGGLLSVALSVGSRPPGITWHLALRSPDFPLPASGLHPKRTATVWPTSVFSLSR